MKNIIYLFFIFLMQVSTCKSQPAPKYSSMDGKAIKHYEKAQAYYDHRDNADAMKELDEAISKDPKFIEAYVMKSYVFTDAKKYDQAIEWMKKAIIINPNFFPANFFTLAQLDLKTGKYADAKADYEDYLRSPAVDPYLKNLSEMALKNCDFAIDAMKHPIPF